MKGAAPCWVMLGPEVAVTVSGVDPGGIRESVAICGARVSSVAPGQEIAAQTLISGYPLKEAPVVSEGCGGLLPGEEIQCSRHGYRDVFFWDGKDRIPTVGRRTDVYLSDLSAPALNGAFGAALIRALALQGVLILHAAGLVIGDLCVLVFGRSGSGKSTLSAAALASGEKVISDDVILVSPNGAGDPHGPVLRPLRRDAYLRLDNRGLLPAAIDRLAVPARGLRENKLCLPRTHLPDSFAEKGALSCILTLGTGNRPHHSRLRQQRHAESLASVVAANAFLGSASSADASRLMATAVRLVSSIPGFTLEVGSALLQNPRRELAYITEQIEEQLEIANPPTDARAQGAHEALRRKPNVKATLQSRPETAG